MPTAEEARVVKVIFAEAVEAPASAHKVIAAAKALRELYGSMAETDKPELLAWVRLHSQLEAFVSGEDKTYYIRVAVRRKGLRRANLEHLERYSSEETDITETAHDDDEEYIFNIWKSEWRYVEGFLKQFEINYNIVSESSEDNRSPQAISGSLL